LIKKLLFKQNRYPVILRQFSIREGSGGRGKFKGGDGVIRELEFRKNVFLFFFFFFLKKTDQLVI